MLADALGHRAHIIGDQVMGDAFLLQNVLEPENRQLREDLPLGEKEDRGKEAGHEHWQLRCMCLISLLHQIIAHHYFFTGAFRLIAFMPYHTPHLAQDAILHHNIESRYAVC